MIDQLFCISQTLQKKWEYNGTVHQPFTDFMNAAHNSVRGEVLNCIIIKFGMPLKLVRLIKVKFKIKIKTIVYKKTFV
jgi:hypothetical protein